MECKHVTTDADLLANMLLDTAGRADSFPRTQIVDGGRRFRPTADSLLSPVMVGSANGTLRMNSGGRIADFAADGATGTWRLIKERLWLFIRHGARAS